VTSFFILPSQTDKSKTQKINNACTYSPTETVEFDFGCKFNNNNRRIRFYHQVITFAINTTTTTCNIEANIANPKPTTPLAFISRIIAAAQNSIFPVTNINLQAKSNSTRVSVGQGGNKINAFNMPSNGLQ
jgi:hypothetical protein